MELIYTDINGFECETTHKKQHSAGRYILKYAAENIYKIKNPEIEIINKKPKFKFSNIEFSVSHSKNIAAICFHTRPVGLDIEYMRPLDYEKIAKRMKFNLKENSIEEFYKNWTLYEAEIKLQNKVQSSKTQYFLDEYMLSVVSCDDKEINLNIISLK